MVNAIPLLVPPGRGDGQALSASDCWACLREMDPARSHYGHSGDFPAKAARLNLVGKLACPDANSSSHFRLEELIKAAGQPADKTLTLLCSDPGDCAPLFPERRFADRIRIGTPSYIGKRCATRQDLLIRKTVPGRWPEGGLDITLRTGTGCRRIDERDTGLYTVLEKKTHFF